MASFTCLAVGTPNSWETLSVHLVTSHPPEDQTKSPYIIVEMFQEMKAVAVTPLEVEA